MYDHWFNPQVAGNGGHVPANGLSQNAVVVLSYCSGLLSNPGAANNLQGIPATFLEHGARCVVGGLWPVVDDVAAQFMDDLNFLCLQGATLWQRLSEAKQLSAWWYKSAAARIRSQTILDAFEDNGWPSRINNPLPSDEPADLYDTLRQLKKDLKHLRFSAQRSGKAVAWHSKKSQ